MTRAVLALSVAKAVTAVCLSATGVSPSHHHHAPHYVVAVTGHHHHLYANRPGSPKLRDLGGHLYGPPAVAYAAGQYFFAAETLHHGLEIRTEKAGWAPLVNRNFACYQPELTSHHGKLAIGCLRDNAVWGATIAPTSAGDPHADALVDQGGTIGTGPAVSFFGARLDFEVIGGDYILGRNDHFNTYYRSFGDPTGRYTQDPMDECKAAPTQTSGPKQFGESYLGCVVGHGKHHRLAVVGITPDGEDPIATPHDAAVGRIGLAPLTQGSMLAAYTTRSGKTVVRRLAYLHQPGHRTVVYRGAGGGAAIAAGPRGYR